MSSMTPAPVEEKVCRQEGRLRAEPVATLNGHAGPVLACRLAGKYAVTGGEDRSVRLFNTGRLDGDDLGGVPEALLVHTFQGPHRYPVSSVELSGDRSLLACCGGDRAAFLWDVRVGSLTRSVRPRNTASPGKIGTLCFGGKDEAATDLLVTGGDDRCLRIFDLRGGSGEICTLAGFQDNVTSITCVGPSIFAACADGCLHTFDTRAGRIIKDNLGYPLSHVSSIFLSPGESHIDRLLVSCLGGPGINNNGKIAMLSTETGALAQTYAGHINKENRIPCGALRVAGHERSLVVCGSEDGALHFWDLESADEQLVLRNAGGLEKSAPISTLACAGPNDMASRVAACSYNGAAVIYHISNM